LNSFTYSSFILPANINTDRLETAEIDIAYTAMFRAPRLILPSNLTISNLTLQIIKVRSIKRRSDLYRTPAIANAYIPTAVRPSTGLNNELATPMTAAAAEVS
jgi:hypothetical protein